MERAPFALGEFVINPARNSIGLGENEARVEPRVMALLCRLAEAHGEVVSRATLVDEVWGKEYGGDESLTQAVSGLRKAFRSISADAPHFVETIPKHGYRLTVAVGPAAPTPSPMPASEAAPTPAPSPAPAPTMRAPIFAIGAAALAVIVLGVVFLLTRKDDTPAVAAASEEAAATSAPADAQVRGGVALAVIPFANLSSDPEQEYFVDGLSEELLNRLANVEGLRVPGSSLAFFYKGQQEDVREIAERLGVIYVLTGSVRKAGDAMRITAQLTEAESGFQMWSATFDRTTDDIFTIQDEVAQSVIIKVLGELPRGGVRDPNAIGDVDPHAHELFLAGRTLWTRRLVSDAFWKFREATQIDPDHWLAQVYLAVTAAYLEFNEYGYEGPKTLAVIAEDAIAAAEALQPDAADVLFARAWVTEFITFEGVDDPGDVNAPRITALYRRVVQANPRHLDALHALARLVESDDEIEALLRQVIEIEPGYFSATVNLAHHYRDKGDVQAGAAIVGQYHALARENANPQIVEWFKVTGDWKTYFVAAVDLLKSDAMSPQRAHALASGLLEVGRTEDAAMFNRLSSEQLGGALGLWALSRADLIERDIPAVADDIQNALAIDSRHPWIRTVAAQASLLMGEPQATLDIILATRPDLLKSDEIDLRVDRREGVFDFEAHVAAAALERLGRADEAAPLWEALIVELDKPQFADWRRHVGRALAFSHLGQVDAAFEELENAYAKGFRFPYTYSCGGCTELDFYHQNGLFSPIFNDPRFAEYVERIERENREYVATIMDEAEIDANVARIHDMAGAAQ